MSDRIPPIVIGDRIRVMQNRAAERNGLVGLRGTVVGGVIRADGERVSFVVIDGERETTHVPESSLMVVSRKTVLA